LRRGELIGNLILFSPLILFTIVSISASIVVQAPKVFYFLALGLLLIGFLALFKAKWSHFRNGEYITFGTKGMTLSNSIFYYFGAISAGIGALLSFSFLFWTSI
jgi:uncharacterized membrane protein